MTKKQIIRALAFDLFGSLFLEIGIDCFAVQANFAPGGVTGLSVMANYLFGLPIGLANILINVPIVLLTWRRLGKTFFLLSAKSILISSLFVDHVACYFPVYSGNRLVACILSGLTAGIGFSLFFNEGSSTGKKTAFPSQSKRASLKSAGMKATRETSSFVQKTRLDTPNGFSFALLDTRALSLKAAHHRNGRMLTARSASCLIRRLAMSFDTSSAA